MASLDSSFPSSNPVSNPFALLASDGSTDKNSSRNNNEAPLIKSPGFYPLKYKWTFYYMHRAQTRTPTNIAAQAYESLLKRIGSFSTVQEFWTLYESMKKPYEMQPTSDIHIFLDGVKPIWEDPLNAAGGKIVLRLRKGISTRFWEILILALIGDSFEVGTEITGMVLSVRHHEDILSVWTMNASDSAVKSKIKDRLRLLLSLPENFNLEYKVHSLPSNSSKKHSLENDNQQ